MSIELRFSIAREAFTLEVDLELPAQGITAIFGPSGCGKTTLLRTIAGLESTAHGYLKVGDQIWQEGADALPTHQRPLGYVFQEPSLFPHLSVADNLQYGLKRLPPAQRKVSLDQAVELLGIAPLLTRSPHQLSGGEQQRVAIARALAVSPAMLLLDEPLAALDPARKEEILPYLESLQQQLEIPVLYVSHSRNEVARLADHMVYLREGKVVATGSVSELFSRLDLPLAHSSDTETVMEATIAAHDDHYHLTYLDFPGGRFSVAQSALPVGNPVRIQIFARDVSLTLNHQEQTSILNIFPATVDQLVEEGPTQYTVRLLVGGVPLLTRITRKSAEELQLRPGLSLYAQVKSVALMR